MTTTKRASCPRCGAGLRRGQRPGTKCDPCRSIGPDLRRDLPPSFYLRNLIDLDQSRISAIERGASWPG